MNEQDMRWIQVAPNKYWWGNAVVVLVNRRFFLKGRILWVTADIVHIAWQ
jgi:hypothetical protein